MPLLLRLPPKGLQEGFQRPLPGLAEAWAGVSLLSLLAQGAAIKCQRTVTQLLW